MATVLDVQNLQGLKMPPETDRDMPDYTIVQACGSVGIERGEDVRWTRVCNCQRLPNPLPKYRFTYADGQEVTIGVFQCKKCLTVYWSEG